MENKNLNLTVCARKITTFTFVLLGILVVGAFSFIANQASAEPHPKDVSCQLFSNPTTVSRGQRSVLTWNTQGIVDYMSISPEVGGVALHDTAVSVFPNTTTTYTMRIGNNDKETTCSATVTVATNTPPPQNPTVNITADNTNVSYGNSTIVRWNSNNATSCFASGGANGWSSSKNLSGSFPTGALTNTGTITYNITCSNGSGGQASSSVTIFVGAQQVQNPTVNITADNTNVSYGNSTIVRWNSNNATSCFASGGTNGWSSSKNLSGSFPTGALFNTTTYSITCTNNSGGQANASVTVFVDDNNNDRRPTVNLYADDTFVEWGEGTYLNWNTTNNPNYCTGSRGTSRWSGSKSTQGNDFYTGPIYNDTTFRITCGNNAGEDDDSVTIRVDDDRNNNRRPNVTLDADRTSIERGQGTYIDWRVTNNPNYCDASGGANGWSGNRSTRGSNFYTGALYSTTTFRMTCRNNAGSDSDSVTIYVDSINNPQPQAPAVSLTADSVNVASNGATTIRWNTNNATSCTASGGSFGWTGAKSIGPGAFFTGSLTGGRTITYLITCSNGVRSATDSVSVTVRPPSISQPPTTPRPTPTSLVLVNSSVDRTQPMVPTLDNTRPRPGDEINYNITYQNIGTGSITNLVLRIDFPFEVDYMFSTPNNPNRSGNTLTFSLGTVRANGEGTVSVRVRLRNDVPPGMNLNFPATLSYVDPSGTPQSVNTNVSAQVWNGEPIDENSNNQNTSLGAGVFGSGAFLPNSIIGWLLLIILILALMLLSRYLYDNFLDNQRRRREIYNSIE